jgi:hypothetical protein
VSPCDPRSQSPQLATDSTVGTPRDYLDGAQAGLQATILGKWNDDILWPAQAGTCSPVPNVIVPHADRVLVLQRSPVQRSTATRR